MTDTQNFSSWNDVNKNRQKNGGASSIFGGYAIFPLLFVLLFVVLPIITGCGSVGEIAEATGDTGESIEDVMRSGEEIAEEAGEAAEEAKEAGQKVRALRSKKFTLELAKGQALDGAHVRVRPAGANQHKTIPAGDFARYSLDVTRFANQANFSIYTEINGRGRPIKVSKEYFTDQQDGPAEILVLTEVRESEFAWLPPSERDDDETIRFNGN